MIERILCKYFDNCEFSESNKCKCCKNNRLRNYKTNWYIPAKDKSILNQEEIRVEDNNAIICPVCSEANHEISVTKKGEYICSFCGVRLNIRLENLSDDIQKKDFGVVGV